MLISYSFSLLCLRQLKRELLLINVVIENLLNLLVTESKLTINFTLTLKTFGPQVAFVSRLSYILIKHYSKEIKSYSLQISLLEEGENILKGNIFSNIMSMLSLPSHITGFLHPSGLLHFFVI